MENQRELVMMKEMMSLKKRARRNTERGRKPGAGGRKATTMPGRKGLGAGKYADALNHL
jgi:hypothetical protein